MLPDTIDKFPWFIASIVEALLFQEAKLIKSFVF